MKVDLEVQGLRLPAGSRAEVEEQVRLALGRLSHRVRRVVVHLSDLNGPRGGQDTRCLVRANLEPRGTLVIDETRHEPFDAVMRASSRLRQAVARRHDRMRWNRGDRLQRRQAYDVMG